MSRAEIVDLNQLLSGLSACPEALEWSRSRSISEESWLACDRGDWLLWIAARLELPRPLVVLAACDCTRLALLHVSGGERRPFECIEVTEAWALGDRTVSLADVREARRVAWAAYAAADAAANAADAAAAVAVAAAADAAYDAAYAAANAAAYYAAAAADAAYAAANAAAAAAARTATLRRCADVVRQRIMWSDIEAALQRRAEA